jgi:hypothetical protein
MPNWAGRQDVERRSRRSGLRPTATLRIRLPDVDQTPRVPAGGDLPPAVLDRAPHGPVITASGSARP